MSTRLDEAIRAEAASSKRIAEEIAALGSVVRANGETLAEQHASRRAPGVGGTRHEPEVDR